MNVRIRIAWLICFAVAGCQEESVQHYNVPKPPPPGGVRYDLPAGWEKSPQLVPMSIATFRVMEGDRKVDVTITPLAGTAGGLSENVNRWRRQINLQPLDDSELQKQTRECTVAGSQAVAVDMAGPESEGQNRLRVLGVIWVHAGKTWFFKMKGPADLVAKQQTAWDSFIKSIRVESDQ